MTKYFWLLPFISFILGYQLLHYMTHVPEYDTPKLVGLSLNEATQTLSDLNLNLRIISKQEEPDLQEGTVLDQTPAAHHTIKQNQPVFLVISKKPPKHVMPQFMATSLRDITDYCKKNSMRMKTHYLATHYPQDTCIGQIPTAGTLMDTKKMSLYISSGNPTSFLLPNFRNVPLSEVQDFLHDYNFSIKVTHSKQTRTDHVCQNCVVIDQQPLSGSLVDLTKNVLLQLQVDY